MEAAVIKLYIDIKPHKPYGELEVNLLLEILRSGVWGMAERELKTRLAAYFNRLNFGDDDRHSVHFPRNHPDYPNYLLHYHAFSGKVGANELREILQYCKREGIEVESHMPKVKFELPFQA